MLVNFCCFDNLMILGLSEVGLLLSLMYEPCYSSRERLEFPLSGLEMPHKLAKVKMYSTTERTGLCMKGTPVWEWEFNSREHVTYAGLIEESLVFLFLLLR